MSIEGRIAKLEAAIGSAADEAAFDEECRLLRVGINAELQREYGCDEELRAALPAPPIDSRDSAEIPFAELRSIMAEYGRRVEAAGFVLNDAYQLVRVGGTPDPD
jgi:hypothetical protein